MKQNSSVKIEDEDFEEQTADLSSIYNDETEQVEIPKDDLNIVYIPNDLQEHLECVVGKHIFIDKPWTKIPRKKIMDNLQSQKSKSCFWQYRKNFEGVTSEHVLVGYKHFRNTNEEFIICTTDKANQYIEETRSQMERELKYKVERTMDRTSGHWESRNSDKNIEEVKPVPTRDKITYKWKIPSKRINVKAEFDYSNSKSMKNEYVKLEPHPNAIFNCSDILVMDSSVQVIGKMVNRECQTIPKISANKCIQSVAVKEEMFQLQPITESNKVLDEFFEKHVPNLVNQLRYNELHDLHRDNYKLINNENDKPSKQNVNVIKFLPGYQNVTNKKYVSCHTWHPIIPGVFAVSYMSNSNALYKSVSLETSTEETTKVTVKDKKGDIISNDDDKSSESWKNQSNIVDENYNEKILSLLNKEFVQKMRIIQVTDNERLEKQPSLEIIKQLRDPFKFPNEVHFLQTQQPKTKNYPIKNKHQFDELLKESLIDENVIEEYDDLTNSVNMEEWSELNYWENGVKMEENVYDGQTNEIKGGDEFMDSFNFIDVEDTEKKTELDHHDSDTESFYNIWGDDEEWLYGNRLRNIVRNIHREFNKKYDRQAKRDILFANLKSEEIYVERNKDNEEMNQKKMKLVEDMFEAADVCKRRVNKNQTGSKIKIKAKITTKQKNEYKAFQNEDEAMIKRESTPMVEDNNNLVVIWSINDNIFPQLRLESPEEVCCVKFNPRDGDVVVGGLTNGQICIWDIKGKLDAFDSNEMNLSEREKMHFTYLWTRMNWSLDVNFKTRIRPAAMSSIFASHDLMVTAIQWIHPMNEITTRGRLMTIQDHFSNQFFSASMDGTIKLWDLSLTSTQKSKEKDKQPSRFGRPKNLENYESPLKIHNNRLKPTYTIIIIEPESNICSPITAMSFQIPLMEYKYTSDQTFVIGKQQFEFVPMTPNDPNRLFVIGNIMGQVGVVTWNGYDVFQEIQNKEECQHVWWGNVHDGPINCIKRNMFFPDIHLACGGHVVSVWSINYKGYPIWWKRFDDFTNSVLWSTVHPSYFQVSFNTGGILQFWDFMQSTHQPYYKQDIFIGDGLIATLSTPPPIMHYNSIKQFKFTEGINEVMNHEKYELISFSDFNGTIIMITIDAVLLKPNEIEEVRYMFENEVNRQKELDDWNNKYKELLGTMGESNMDDNYNPKNEDVSVKGSVSTKNDILALTQEQIMRQICKENFKWYFNQKVPETRSGKMEKEYLEKEAQYRIETMMKKKNIDKSQLEECLKKTEEKDEDVDVMTKIRSEANETYKDIMKKLMAAEQNKEYVFDIDSKRSIDFHNIKLLFERIHQLLVTNFHDEKRKFKDEINDIIYNDQREDWEGVIENVESEVREYLLDNNCFKIENLRKMRQKWTEKSTDGDTKMKVFKRKVCDRYKTRRRKIDWSKALGGENGEEAIGGYEQSYDSFEQENGEGDGCYAENLSSVNTFAAPSFSDSLGEKQSVFEEHAPMDFDRDEDDDLEMFDEQEETQ